MFQPPGTDGAAATTVFANDAGHFSFPRPVKDELRVQATVEAKALGYRMVFPAHQAVKLPTAADGQSADPLVLVLQPERNHADSAPASSNHLPSKAPELAASSGYRYRDRLCMDIQAYKPYVLHCRLPFVCGSAPR